MSASTKYDVLFEPVPIGPVTAPNRFYQVPHCNGLGHARPFAEARNRGIKAEGGWGVVSTQEVEIHPTAEVSPFQEGRLWDDKDIPYHRMTTEAIHEHGALAAIELVHMGHHASNRSSRLAPLSAVHMPVDSIDPVNARAMDKKDIANLRQWHVDAAIRSMQAGYDIVYVYAAHNMSILMHFLQARINNRSDEYGGSVVNRLRLTREILEAVKDAVGHRCGVAFRLAVDELMGADGIQAREDGREIVTELAELPDLWDVNISDWSNDSATARFQPDEGYQLPYTDFVKSVTSKPVVGVGRFTSADKMVAMVKKGQLDFIGAARPSIADPFLPNKIREGNLDLIRECIGCNICVASDNIVAPIRCTQNPTQGEEWRKGWHPESIEPATGNEQILVVGSGPAGLESALQLAERGYQVMLAEASDQPGGRSLKESRLPGLSSYKRVADYRIGLIKQHRNIALHLGNKLSANDIHETDISHICLATGAHWCGNGFGRTHHDEIDLARAKLAILTPDDLIENIPSTSNHNLVEGIDPASSVLVYDDDHYYMGGVIAEYLQEQGFNVTLATTESIVSGWTVNTLEQEKIQSRLLSKNVTLHTSKFLSVVDGYSVELACTYGGSSIQSDFSAIVMVTSRLPDVELYKQLQKLLPTDALNQGSKSLRCIGDCYAPSTIAAAIYQGHQYARTFGLGSDSYSIDYKREIIDLRE